MPLAALALLASCSNDKLDGPEPGSNDSKVYGTFYINLPSSNGTRAVSGYESGDYEEYAVTSGKILLFQKKADDASATFVTSADLVNVESSEEGNDNWDNGSTEITATTKQATAEFTGIDKNVDYVALVVLNPGSLRMPDPGQSFSDWNTHKTVTKAQAMNEEGFMMTNAPQFVATDKTPTTLVDIDENELKEKAEDLKNAGTAGTFYVQRVVAKIEVKFVSGVDVNTKKFPVKGSDADFVDFSSSNWLVDVENTVAYPVQNVSGFTSWISTDNGNQSGRFYSSTNTKRIWWAEDPNYTSGSYYDNENPEDPPFVNGIQRANTNSDEYHPFVTGSAYCMENTMEYNKMEQDKTTRLILHGVYNLGGHFGSFITYGNLSLPVVNTDINEEVRNDGDKYKASELFTEEKLAELNRDYGIKESTEVTYYPGGHVYYVVRIRHFDDTETPLVGGVASADEYQTKHRGRYGVLRNNLYEVVINSIEGPGAPNKNEVPKDPTPDDPKDSKYSMNVQINILDWAKRSYGYDLK